MKDHRNEYIMEIVISFSDYSRKLEECVKMAKKGIIEETIYEFIQDLMRKTNDDFEIEILDDLALDLCLFEEYMLEQIDELETLRNGLMTDLNYKQLLKNDQFKGLKENIRF